MNKMWPNKEDDISAAEQIIEQYASKHNTEALGLFELFLNEKEKRMNFRLSNWVLALVDHFQTLYGAIEGEYITRKIITRCLTNGQTLH